MPVAGYALQQGTHGSALTLSMPPKPSRPQPQWGLGGLGFLPTMSSPVLLITGTAPST